MTGVIVIGAGGHGRVVADALVAAGASVLGFTDSNGSLHGQVVDGIAVLGDDSALARFDRAAVSLALGVGSVGLPAARERIGEALLRNGWTLATVVHPSAIVSRSAVIEAGAQVMAGAIVQRDVRIGVGAIVNTGAQLDHGCVIGRFTHIAPGVVLSGDVTIGDGSHVGVGAVVVQEISLGRRTVVAAGAVVIADDSGDSILQGVPASRRRA